VLGEELDVFFRSLSDEFQSNVQRFWSHPARVGRESLHAFDEAFNVGAEFGVEIDADE
jgi:hypothetical protein